MSKKNKGWNSGPDFAVPCGGCGRQIGDPDDIHLRSDESGPYVMCSECLAQEAVEIATEPQWPADWELWLRD